MLWTTSGIVISYLIGSIPTAYIFGRILKGIDIRKFGSGNVGATNALRVLGRFPALVVLLIDVLKGFIVATLLANYLAFKINFISEELLRIILGLSCIAGHNWTVFLGFKGGKGVATTLGVLLGLSLNIAGLKVILGFLILTWVVIFAIVRIVSIASVITAVALPIYIRVFGLSQALLYLGIVLAIFIILRHISNLKRVFQGKESRLPHP